MKLKNAQAQVFVPDGMNVKKALTKTTHIGIGAHHDDLEVMAYHGILQHFENKKNWFLGVTVTDGRGSPRSGVYARYTDEEMRKVRRVEQKKAASVGEYTAVCLLEWPSELVKNPKDSGVREDLKEILKAAKPSYIYTHNIADKHPTHVAVAVKTIQSLRELRDIFVPEAVFGCEVWRGLDWMNDKDKVALDVSSHEGIANALVGLFDSQVCGGKRYDIATIGRRRANATYLASHEVDKATHLIFAMDLAPLVKDISLDIEEYVVGFIKKFEKDVRENIKKLMQG